MERFELSSNQELDAKLWLAYRDYIKDRSDNWYAGIFEGFVDAYLTVTHLHLSEVMDALIAERTRENV